MHKVKQAVLGCVVVMGVSLGLLVTGAQAQSGSLEPPGSAVDGAGDPVATTQTQPSWDQNLPAAERFVTVLDTTVANIRQAILDRNTGLVWERYPGDTDGNFVINSADRVDWLTARRYCLGQTDGNVFGWRLPSVHELQSLLDPTNPGGNPDLPAGHPFLSSVQSSVYWSATTNAGNPTDAWLVIFNDGNVTTNVKTGTVFVWCVRGGGPLSEY